MRSILSITVLLLLVGVAHADNVEPLNKQEGDS